MQHPQQGASTHRPRRLRVKRSPVEKAMPYDTALPLLQESASAEASEGASPHRSTQSGQCTVQPDRARDSVPVLAGTRHPQPTQSAGYLFERGLFKVCMVCSGSGFRVSNGRMQASAQQSDRSARAHAVRLGSLPASPALHARCLAEWGGARQRRLASRSGRRGGLRLGLGLGLFAWFVFGLGLSWVCRQLRRKALGERCEKFAKWVGFVAEKPD